MGGYKGPQCPPHNPSCVLIQDKIRERDVVLREIRGIRRRLHRAPAKMRLFPPPQLHNTLILFNKTGMISVIYVSDRSPRLREEIPRNNVHF